MCVSEIRQMRVLTVCSVGGFMVFCCYWVEDEVSPGRERREDVSVDISSLCTWYLQRYYVPATSTPG